MSFSGLRLFPPEMRIVDDKLEWELTITMKLAIHSSLAIALQPVPISILTSTWGNRAW